MPRCGSSRHSLSLSLFLLALIATSCSPGPNPGSQASPIDATEVYKAGQSGFEGVGRELVSDSLRWEAIWEGKDAPMRGVPLPPIDFTRYSVLVAAGPPMNVGDSVEIDSVRIHGDRITARVTHYARCLPVQLITVPVDMVRVPRGPRRLKVVEREVRALTCDPHP
jgi:hypothetical protein